jgi:ribonuclease HI
MKWNLQQAARPANHIPTMKCISVYCDGSITDAVLVNPMESHLGGDYVARLMVLIPELDLGTIRQERSDILTPRGTPNSAKVEGLAIQTAFEFCAENGIEDFVVYSDCQPTVDRLSHPRVRWAPREEMYLPNTYFDRVLGRAGYLRQSAARVQQRRPVQPHQQEIFELFQAAHRDFRLSKSPLWSRILRDVKRHPRALGHPG